MPTSMFVKKWRNLNHYCVDVEVWVVNIAPIESQSASKSNKGSKTELNSPDNVEEDDDACHERELIEALDAINAIKKFVLESNTDDYDRHMEDVLRDEEIPSQPNEPDNLAHHFAWLNARLD